MFDTFMRRLKGRLIERLAAPLSSASPNLITLLGLLIGLTAAFLAAIGSVVPSLLVWFLSRVIDGLDGLVARRFNKQSDFGGYLDIVCDFAVYAAVPIGLTLSQPTTLNFIALAVMLASFYINAASWMYLSALLEKRAARDVSTQTSIIMPSGLIGGTESITAFCIFLLFPVYLAPLFGIFSALVFVTVIQRLVWAKQNL
ncbi:MAG: CDP-alcohol phosphatidyltransferase family protein [Anaerolineae bacterium]|nr:CDP-alcohol phosphatidyltransferase family protein [Anaerolineae bacterium]